MQYRIPPLNGDDRSSVPAIDIFSKALKYLKEKLISFIDTKLEGLHISDNSHDIRWVLTIPAIWGAGARHFMRESAYKVCNNSSIIIIILKYTIDSNYNYIITIIIII